jgi:uroporphyrinogen III methyltransferase/synthase
MIEPNSNVGRVYLVGAGPGDPGLLTLRGAECLRMADVVLYDYLACPQLLEIARVDAELICLGRHGHGRLMSQAAINQAMIRHAQAGRMVVRLKGGDPMVFARGTEELGALEATGIPYEIVPGITAAQAASSHVGLPLTGRDEASCVAFVTGQESAEKSVGVPPLDYAALARFPGTLVFYMGVTTAPTWSRALLDHGKSPATPTAIIRRCSWPDQQVFFTTLGELAEVVKSQRLRPPAVIIVGDVACERAVPNWFTARPLFGRTVLVTRPKGQADRLTAQLRNLGANVLIQPAIEIGPPRDWSPVDAVIGRLAEFEWLVFSSANGVDYFLRRLLELGGDARTVGHTRLAAIGPATVEALSRYSLRADLQPEQYRAEALAEALAPQVSGKRVLLARASRGREVLAQMLAAAGSSVEQVVVYESRDVVIPEPTIVEALAAGHIQWTTVTSSAIARSLVKLFGNALRQTRLVAISPLTAEVLAELGQPAALVAEDFTAEGIVTAILAAGSEKP